MGGVCAACGAACASACGTETTARAVPTRTAGTANAVRNVMDFLLKTSILMRALRLCGHRGSVARHRCPVIHPALADAVRALDQFGTGSLAVLDNHHHAG